MPLLIACLAAAVAGLLPLSVSQIASKQKIIINTDPGIDDSMAILLALSADELDVLGITVNFGSLHNTTILAENALRACELAGRPDIPVFIGSSEPLAMKFHDYGGTHFHGEDGLGNSHYPAPKGQVNASMSAVEFLLSAVRAHPNQVVIVSLAPVTNLALAIRMDPLFASLVKRVYMMGGTVAEPGNVSPLAEANIANDAPAAKVLFESEMAITVAGLDVTMHMHWTRDYMRELGAVNSAGYFINQIMQFYFDAYSGTGFPYAPCHDPSAVMALLDPTVFTEQRYQADVAVSQTGDAWHGMMIVDRRGGPLSPTPPGFARFPSFLVGVNQTAFRVNFRTRIARLPSPALAIMYS